MDRAAELRHRMNEFHEVREYGDTLHAKQIFGDIGLKASDRA
jgi:hypothetical protein